MPNGRKRKRAIAIVLAVVTTIWVVGVARAAYSAGDFCGTEGGERARSHPDYAASTSGGFETRTKLFPPQMICVFHTPDGRKVEGLGSAYFD
ncbi:MAG: hypothetical protein Q8K63_06135 [Acidimicrobiales bacterium]|nr:hypothetical protein [Acidimicrobiales bacterium]